MKAKSKNAKTKRAGGNAGGTSAIEISHHPEDSDRVLNLLGRFGGCGGGATPEEAATKLASMAMFLGNIASGHMRARVDGMDCDLGMDFLVEGGMASADFVASVIAPASWLQGRWERNLLHDVIPQAAWKKGNTHLMEAEMDQDALDSFVLPLTTVRRHFAACQKAYAKEVSEGLPASAGASGLHGVPVKLMPADLVSMPLLTDRRTTLLREATEFPFFLFKMSGTARLRKCAARAHLGHLVVHTRVESPTCLAKLRRSLSEIGEGSLSGQPGGSPTVRVNQVLCANSEVLDRAIAAARRESGNVSGLLWLVESSPGCDLPAGMAASPPPDFYDICGRELRRRINFSDGFGHELKALDGRMAAWREFLREQDRHLPGIISTAWNLPVALCYGLEAMLKHESKMDGAEVIALAKWLVLRMSNRFAAAVHAGDSEAVRRLAGKLAGKLLEHGPLTPIQLTRRTSKLRVDGCLRALEWLSKEGVAASNGDTWSIVCDADAVRERIG